MSDPLPPLPPLPPMPPMPPIESLPLPGDGLGLLDYFTRLLNESLGVPAELLRGDSADATFSSDRVGLRTIQASSRYLLAEFPIYPIPANTGAIQPPDPPRNPNAKNARG